MYQSIGCIDRYVGMSMGGWKVVIASSGVCMDAVDGAAVLQKYNFDDMKKILLPTTIEEVKKCFRFILPNVPRLPDSHYEELLEVGTLYLRS